MTRAMFDSTTAADIPLTSELVAGYIDGTYKWSDDDWTRFPNAVKVRVAVLSSTNDGDVLDIETGDATPDQAPRWAVMRRAAGRDPSVYVNLSNVDLVRDAFRLAGTSLPHLWLAHYDGLATLPDGYVAKQYADAAMTGGHYDASVVADFWPGVDGMDQAQVDAAIIAKLADYGITDTGKFPSVVKQLSEIAHHHHELLAVNISGYTGEPLPVIQP